MVYLGQLKHVWLGHSQIIVNEKFRDGTARNNAFRPGLPFWCQIAHSQLILGCVCVKPCISIVVVCLLCSLRYYMKADTLDMILMHNL